MANNVYTAKNGNTYVQLTDAQFDAIQAQNARQHEEVMRMLREIKDLLGKDSSGTEGLLPTVLSFKMLTTLVNS